MEALKAGRTPEDIEKEMKELFPKKTLAYADFVRHRDRWNELVDELELIVSEDVLFKTVESIIRSNKFFEEMPEILE